MQILRCTSILATNRIGHNSQQHRPRWIVMADTVVRIGHVWPFKGCKPTLQKLCRLTIYPTVRPVVAFSKFSLTYQITKDHQYRKQAAFSSPF